MWQKIEDQLAELYQYFGARSTDSRIGYMDGIDFMHELGEGNAPEGNMVYPSPEAVISGQDHDVFECGVVKVEVISHGWVPLPKKKKKKK